MVMMQPYPVIDLSATGANIERLRKARGLSVRDLQVYFGFEAPQAIYKWQRGQSLPTVDNLYALSTLLHVPMEAILVSFTPSVIYKEAVCESKQPLPFDAVFPAPRDASRFCDVTILFPEAIRPARLSPEGQTAA